MDNIIYLALAMMLGGLGICWLSAQAGNALLKTVFWWVGIIIAVVGLLIVLARIIVWVEAHLRAAIGA